MCGSTLSVKQLASKEITTIAALWPSVIPEITHATMLNVTVSDSDAALRRAVRQTVCTAPLSGTVCPAGTWQLAAQQQSLRARHTSPTSTQQVRTLKSLRLGLVDMTLALDDSPSQLWITRHTVQMQRVTVTELYTIASFTS